MTESQQKIQERIRQIKSEKMSLQSTNTDPIKPVESSLKRKFMPILMGCCIVLLTIATIGLMVNKKSNADVQQITSNSNTPNYILAFENDKMIVGNRLDNLESQVATWKHRTWLLSMAVNENANLAKKQHNAGYITFNNEWRLSNTPATMSLSEETKNKLNR